MPPAQTTFVQLCRTNNIAAVPANQRLQFLRDAATLASEGLSAKSLAERCAALSLARDSLQNSVDPDTWPTILTPALYPYLQGLYTIPPYKGAPPTPSNERRLADIITSFTPADGAANAANAQQPPQDGININRQDGNANNIAADFSHQTLLSPSDGAHFDPPKRGLALAGAGRSATAAGASGQTLSDTVARDAHLRTLRDQWTAALPAFAADTELSGSHVNNLWGGVHSIMTIRAARSSTWGVQEVEDACSLQLASLPSYRSAVASVISRVATAYTGVEVPRSVNRAYLQFFLPFWWEHILERGRLDDTTAEKQAALLLKPATEPPGRTANAPSPVPEQRRAQKWLMHDVLLAYLPADGYPALHMSPGMPYKARVKLQDSCTRDDMTNLLDCTTADALSYRTSLSFADGAHFDPPKRGPALAGTGRPAALAGASGPMLADNVCRRHRSQRLSRQQPLERHVSS
jgi:hypothetical protein